MSKYLIILVNVTFGDLPKKLCDHMPQRVTPLSIMGSRLLNLVMFPQGTLTPVK